MALHSDRYYNNCNQKFSENGRILVSTRAWTIRIGVLIGIIVLMAYNFYNGLTYTDPFIAFSTLMPANTLLIFLTAWIFYRSPAIGKVGDDLVSVIIPTYNQKDMIEVVIDAVFRSTYKNIEVIIVNDGSNDGTREILEYIIKKYPCKLKVVNQENHGKRKAVAVGFMESKGEYVIMLDSDSVIDQNAITEIMKAFSANPNAGSATGQLRVWRMEKNILTKMQDAWWNYTSNVHKACESNFGSVSCCSGALSGYRRAAIADFMPYWIHANKDKGGADREISAYAIAPIDSRKDLAEAMGSSKISLKLKESAAHYDESEDRLLTAHCLSRWDAIYVASAIVYSDAPDKLKRFFRQQTRWKKAYLRTNLFLSTFFWRKRSPFISTIYYNELMSTLSTPLIIFTILIYEPFIINNFFIPIVFVSGMLLTGLIQGLDIRFRDPLSKNWKYKILMNMFLAFVVSWLLLFAILTIKKNSWLTR
jgi:hyaluronan synthase